MRWLALIALLCLQSCGLFARYAPDFEIPVEETQAVVDRVALLPNYDVDGSGVVDALEFDTFLTQLATWAALTYGTQPPPPDPTHAEVELEEPKRP